MSTPTDEFMAVDPDIDTKSKGSLENDTRVQREIQASAVTNLATKNIATTPISSSVPVNAAVIFSEFDTLHRIHYSATLIDGSPIPSWLRINPLTGVVSSSLNQNSASTIDLVVSATDSQGESLSRKLRLESTPEHSSVYMRDYHYHASHTSDSALDGNILDRLPYQQASLGNNIKDSANGNTSNFISNEWDIGNSEGDVSNRNPMDIIDQLGPLEPSNVSNLQALAENIITTDQVVNDSHASDIINNIGGGENDSYPSADNLQVDVQTDTATPIIDTNPEAGPADVTLAVETHIEPPPIAESITADTSAELTQDLSSNIESHEEVAPIENNLNVDAQAESYPEEVTPTAESHIEPPLVAEHITADTSTELTQDLSSNIESHEEVAPIENNLIVDAQAESYPEEVTPTAESHIELPLEAEPIAADTSAELTQDLAPDVYPSSTESYVQTDADVDTAPIQIATDVLSSSEPGIDSILMSINDTTNELPDTPPLDAAQENIPVYDSSMETIQTDVVSNQVNSESSTQTDTTEIDTQGINSNQNGSYKGNDSPGKSGEDHGKSGEDHGKSGEDHGNDVVHNDPGEISMEMNSSGLVNLANTSELSHESTNDLTEQEHGLSTTDVLNSGHDDSLIAFHEESNSNFILHTDSPSQGSDNHGNSNTSGGQSSMPMDTGHGNSGYVQIDSVMPVHGNGHGHEHG